MFLRALRSSALILGAMAVLAAMSHVDVAGQDSAKKNARQGSSLPSNISNQTYRVTVDVVNILCSVFDKNTNTFVTTLTRDDFNLYENNQKQEIKYFARESNLPLTLAMLVDTSDSVSPKLKFEQEAATSFFQTILRENDRAMLMEFNSGVNMLQDFTGDPNKMARQIGKLKAAGGTALYDAIYRACDEKLIRVIGRKAIIILSDGEDMSSNVTLQQAAEMALRAEATVFAISVNKGGFFGVTDRSSGDKILKDLAYETGGKVFFPFKVEDLDDNFRQINQELRSQYSLGYVSTNTLHDGSYRKIEVKVKDRGLKLNYRKGYYAPAN